MRLGTFIDGSSFVSRHRRHRCAASVPPQRVRSFAAAAAAIGRRIGDAALNAAFEDIFAERIRSFAGLRHLARPRQGRNSRTSARPSIRSHTEVARTKALRATRKALAASARSRRRRCRRAAALNREIVIYDLERSLACADEVRPRQRPEPVSDHQPAGRELFSIPDFLNSRTRSKLRPTPKPISRACRNSPSCSTTRPPSSSAQAARGFLAPGWSLDLALGQMAKLREPAGRRQRHGRRRSPTAPRPRASPATGRRARRKIVEREVYPAIDRQIAVLSELRPTTRPGDGATRLPERRGALCRSARPGDDHHHDPGGSPPARARRRSPNIPASLDGVLKQAGLHAGQRRRAAGRAQYATRRSFIPTPTPAARQLLAEPQRQCEGDDGAACPRRSRRCPTSRSKSAAFRRKSRTARPTAITTRRRSTARARRSTGST